MATIHATTISYIGDYVKNRIKITPGSNLERFIIVYQALPTEQQQEIDGLCAVLQEKVKGMGIASALELVGALGEFLYKREVK